MSERPALRIVRGNPSEEEIAAILAVVATRSRTRVEPPRKFSLWARKSRFTRPIQRPGYGAWRGSMMPR